MKSGLGIPIFNLNRHVESLDVSLQASCSTCETALTVTHNGDGVVPATFSNNVATVTSTEYSQGDNIILWASCLARLSTCSSCNYNKYK